MGLSPVSRGAAGFEPTHSDGFPEIQRDVLAKINHLHGLVLGGSSQLASD